VNRRDGDAAGTAARGLNRRDEADRRSAHRPYRGLPAPGGRVPDLGVRPAYSAEAEERILGGCGLMGVCDESGSRMSGELAVRSMASMHDRGNGLGGGFAGYGIYPDFPHAFCFHMLYSDDGGRDDAEYYLARHFVILHHEPIPTKPVKGISDEPILWRYFLEISDERLEETQLSAEDYVVHAVMDVNAHIQGAFVASSGRNMGAFKGVGFPEEVGEFYQLDTYKGWTWTGHGRFPTNTPGWWGGAHPFCLLDYSIVHNGEISSYGINQRYLEGFGYNCTLRTDTEVVTYLFDLMLRRHGLPVEIACKALASPFWKDIDLMPDDQRRLDTALRMVYGPALLNGPFAVVLGMAEGMVALNDRIKLRPLVAARDGSTVYVASEESAIREICPKPEKSWMPRAGEPVIARLQDAAAPTAAASAGAAAAAPTAAVTAA
jgi:glutamate synthase domain-containing protein 1